MSEAENSLIRVESVAGMSPGPVWSFSVARGGAAWIPDERDSQVAWLDWLTGIAPPPAGRVFWKGVEWSERSPDDAAAERGCMGCVFAQGGVVVNLDMDENVWLPARMHRRADAAESIEHWARFFGCWPLPQERAPAVRERDRRRILWTRAFAGNPEAVVLDHPLHGAPEADHALLRSALVEVRAAGCAVIWLGEKVDAQTRAALEPLADIAPESK